jgi:hypothetical protein
MKRIHNDIGAVCSDCGCVIKTRGEMSQFEKECMDGNQDCLPLMCKECLSHKLNNSNLISDVYNTTTKED